ncbi:unnamed protein product [Sympodiomycopsis kandeliae]
MSTAIRAKNGLDDQRHIEALYKWLAIQDDTARQDELRKEIQQDPLKFLQSYLDVLPSHLLLPLASATTPSQRGKIALIRERRRLYAQQHDCADEFDILPARRRLRTLWKRLVRSNVPLDKTSTTANSGKMKDSDTGEVFENPRLTRLMQEQDEQEEILRDTQEEEEESEEEPDQDELDAEDEQAIQAFQFAVLQRFIKGDPTISPSLYAQIDFQDDAFLSNSQSSSASASAARESEQMQQDRYFDDD